MRKLIHTLFAGALALSLAAPALADPPRHANARGHDRGADRGHDRDVRHQNRGPDRRADNRRRDDRRYDNHRKDNKRNDYRRDQQRHTSYRYSAPVYVAPRYPAPRYYAPPAYYAPQRHAWRPGGYLPRNTRYHVINDYHRYGFAPPRRGHYYADVDGDILLIAAATGLIVWALNN